MCIKLWASPLHIIPQNSVKVASVAAEGEHTGPLRARGRFISRTKSLALAPFIAPKTQCAFPRVSINDPIKTILVVILCRKKTQCFEKNYEVFDWDFVLSLSHNGQIIGNSIYLFEWSRGDSLYKSNCERPVESLFLSLILLVSAELLELFATG